MRGTVDWEDVDLERRGIIPACAGNRLNHPPCSRCHRDHPRVCGEQDLADLRVDVV